VQHLLPLAAADLRPLLPPLHLLLFQLRSADGGDQFAYLHGRTEGHADQPLETPH